MALGPKLELRQSQSLVMTPQLMQAIKLLQLGSIDLVAYVEAELERNPLLERDEGDDRPLPEVASEPAAPAADGPMNGEAGDFAIDAAEAGVDGSGPALDTAFEGELRAESLPQGWSLTPDTLPLRVEPGGRVPLDATLTLPETPGEEPEGGLWIKLRAGSAQGPTVAARILVK